MSPVNFCFALSDQLLTLLPQSFQHALKLFSCLRVKNLQCSFGSLPIVRKLVHVISADALGSGTQIAQPRLVVALQWRAD